MPPQSENPFGRVLAQQEIISPEQQEANEINSLINAICGDSEKSTQTANRGVKDIADFMKIGAGRSTQVPVSQDRGSSSTNSDERSMHKIPRPDPSLTVEEKKKFIADFYGLSTEGLKGLLTQLKQLKEELGIKTNLNELIESHGVRFGKATNGEYFIIFSDVIDDEKKPTPRGSTFSNTAPSSSSSKRVLPADYYAKHINAGFVTSEIDSLSSSTEYKVIQTKATRESANEYTLSTPEGVVKYTISISESGGKQIVNIEESDTDSSKGDSEVGIADMFEVKD